jgi:SpoVK/Ycf46/Vps4 family AAA+-type ATPase
LFPKQRKDQTVKTTTTKTAGAQCASDISALLRARNPLIWCVTREEARAERIVIDAAAAAGYVPMWWDCANGISNLDGPVNPGAADPSIALAEIRASNKRQVWVMRDLHAFLKDAFVQRSLKSLCRTLPQAPRDNARAVVIVSPSSEVPIELAGHAIVVDIPLPDRAEIAALLDAAVDALPDDIKTSAAPNGTRDAAIDAALGLTSEEAQSTFARSLIATRRIDPATVANEKRRVIARERVLEWFDPLPTGLDSIGGLELLKDWLIERHKAFSPAAREYGLPTPKGVFLVGVPGSGKSLTAKAVATAWKMPCLRLDMGALKSKWQGESEANIRRALKVAETVSPCVLWLDEIEKALSGATQGGAADGGVAMDALGAILTWMQEREGSSVFVVATANDVSKLPPELLRKERFDEVFFVDLATTVERAAILKAALRKHERTEAIDIEWVAKATDGFNGVEVASLIPAAMYAAFADGARPITNDDVMYAATQIVPLSKTASEKISTLREWAKGRARPASKQIVADKSDRRALDM